MIDIRYITALSVGTLTRASGSCVASFGGTRVAVAVNGPRPRPPHSAAFSDRCAVVCSFEYAPFSQLSFSQSLAAVDSVSAASFLSDALSPAVHVAAMPKSVIDVHCLVLADRGSVLPCAITAASLALADAGIPMFGLVPCVSVAVVVGQTTQLLPMCAQAAEQQAAAVVTLAFISSLGTVPFVRSLGKVAPDTLDAAILAAKNACLRLVEPMSSSLRTAAEAAIEREASRKRLLGMQGRSLPAAAASSSAAAAAVAATE
jgi:ribonuclease PH